MPKLSAFESHFEPQIIERGKRYFKDNQVKRLIQQSR